MDDAWSGSEDQVFLVVGVEQENGVDERRGERRGLWL